MMSIEKLEIGTFENPIIDSLLTEEVAKAQNPDFLCSKEILDKQIVLPVKYFSFDNKIHQGQIVIDERLRKDVEEIFLAMLKNNFPVSMAIPVADEKIKWSDVLSMEKNNCSGFNYRKIAGEDRLSIHSFGQAIDINPAQNPYEKDGIIYPAGSKYDISQAGTIIEDGFLVKIMEDNGWIWGGRWDKKDYHHFQKQL